MLLQSQKRWTWQAVADLPPGRPGLEPLLPLLESRSPSYAPYIFVAIEAWKEELKVEVDGREYLLTCSSRSTTGDNPF